MMKLNVLFLTAAVLISGTLSFPQKRTTSCNSFCPMFMIQFCGSDGKTYYSNECFLKSQWCNEGKEFESFHTLHMGKCTGTELLGDTSTVEPAPIIV